MKLSAEHEREVRQIAAQQELLERHIASRDEQAAPDLIEGQAARRARACRSLRAVGRPGVCRRADAIRGDPRHRTGLGPRTCLCRVGRIWPSTDLNQLAAHLLAAAKAVAETFASKPSATPAQASAARGRARQPARVRRGFRSPRPGIAEGPGTLSRPADLRSRWRAANRQHSGCDVAGIMEGSRPRTVGSSE